MQIVEDVRPQLPLCIFISRLAHLDKMDKSRRTRVGGQKLQHARVVLGKVLQTLQPEEVIG